MWKPRFATVAWSTAIVLLVGAGAILTIGWYWAVRVCPQDRNVSALAVSPGTADAPVARALRTLLAGTHINGVQRVDRTSISDFYAARGYVPLWIENCAPGRRFIAARDYLASIHAEGLNPKDYPFPAVEGRDAAALASAEIHVTSTVLRFARHAQNGRVAFARISPEIYYDTKPIRSAQLLAAIERAENVADVLSAQHPSHVEYRLLRAKLAELSAGNPARDIVLVNMERWRWLPRELGESRVVVNVANYTLTLLREGAPHFKSNVVVGKRSSPTPLLSSTITSLTINPIWNVPRSIVENEMLPAFRKNPDLSTQLGITIATRSDGSPHIFQLPGATSALGRVRFNFPNKFAVYQHDTPDTFLFEQPMRAFSHGCVRVEHAAHYAVALLSIALPHDRTVYERLRAQFGEREIDIDLGSSVVVHLTYQTAFVDDAEQLVLVPDIYGYDTRISAALRTADALAPNKPPNVGRTAERSWGHRVTDPFRQLADRTRASLDQVIATAGEILGRSP